MADKYTEKAVDKANGTVFISHGACEADAKLLADILKERHGVEVKVITDVGPVIGAHSGPGTLALFFVANER
jgi:fatty acid-binding protein DegV